MRLLGLLGLLLAPACDAFAWAPRHTHNSRILYSAHLRPRRSAAATGSRSWRCDLPVTLRTPLGIVFEEVQPGEPKGLIVANLVAGGNAERDGKIQVGDKLVSTSAVVLDSSNQPIISLGSSSATNSWKRQMIACGNMDFTTIMQAIQSNSGRYGYRDVRLVVRRTNKSIPRSTDTIQRNAPQPESKGVDVEGLVTLGLLVLQVVVALGLVAFIVDVQMN
mmetsp:Transcript_24148/g.38905  ORF Transcript_24148/g.38905 Transcript_24148/m.38905 type:complete len:220 (+) Transcript_24148:47-706(+)